MLNNNACFSCIGTRACTVTYLQCLYHPQSCVAAAAVPRRISIDKWMYVYEHNVWKAYMSIMFESVWEMCPPLRISDRIRNYFFFIRFYILRRPSDYDHMMSIWCSYDYHMVIVCTRRSYRSLPWSYDHMLYHIRSHFGSNHCGS